MEESLSRVEFSLEICGNEVKVRPLSRVVRGFVLFFVFFPFQQF